MDDITDLPFRSLCKAFGADLLITEFVASEAINHEAEKSYRKMRFEKGQRPIGIQIFGADEAALLQCLETVEAQQPDFIDINWGCPARKVAGRGAGSGMLKDPALLVQITASVVRHAHLPVTVKTRLGYDDSDKPIVQLAEALQDIGVAALSIHGRTKSQMYRGEADSENRIKELKADFSVDSFVTHNFWATEACGNFIVMAYNFFSLFRHALINSPKKSFFKTIRYELINTPAYFSKSKDKHILYIARSLKTRSAFQGIWSALDYFNLPYKV